ncbi:MAG: VWA-like domain-containing protein, partial [Pseudomonadota bacterium]
RPENVLAEWDCDQLYMAISAAEPSPDSEEGAIRQYAHAQGFEPDLKGSDPSKADVEVWSGRVEQALRQGQSAGSGIGAVLHQFGDLPRAVVPWEIKLRRLLAKALADQPRQSYRRPARGWLARDALARQTGRNSPVFEPGTVRQTDRPRLVIGIDTSSSIQRSTLEMFASEAVSMVRRTGAEAHLIGFDTEVHSLTRMQNADALKSLSMRREGGTSFGPALAKAQSLDPSLIVMLTDLDAPMPTAPKAPVLWSVPYAPRQAPGFGEVLVMSDTPEA